MILNSDALIEFFSAKYDSLIIAFRKLTDRISAIIDSSCGLHVTPPPFERSTFTTSWPFAERRCGDIFVGEREPREAEGMLTKEKASMRA